MNPQMDHIRHAVCNEFGLEPQMLMLNTKISKIARPRQVAMYAARRLTPRSLPNIGRYFSRDHTTVLHAMRRVEQLCHDSNEFAWRVGNALDRARFYAFMFSQRVEAGSNLVGPENVGLWLPKREPDVADAPPALLLPPLPHPMANGTPRPRATGEVTRGAPYVVRFNDEEMPLKKAVSLSGLAVSYRTVRGRIARGWPLERALTLPPGNRPGRYNGIRPLVTEQSP